MLDKEVNQHTAPGWRTLRSQTCEVSYRLGRPNFKATVARKTQTLNLKKSRKEALWELNYMEQIRLQEKRNIVSKTLLMTELFWQNSEGN